MSQEATTQPEAAVDSWDGPLLAAHALGEVIVYRGEYPRCEIDVVPLNHAVADKYGDACERAFQPANRVE